MNTVYLKNKRKETASLPSSPSHSPHFLLLFFLSNSSLSLLPFLCFSSSLISYILFHIIPLFLFVFLVFIHLPPFLLTHYLLPLSCFFPNILTCTIKRKVSESYNDYKFSPYSSSGICVRDFCSSSYLPRHDINPKKRCPVISTSA